MDRVVLTLFLAFLAALPITRPAAIKLGKTPVQLSDLLLLVLMGAAAAQLLRRKMTLPLGRLALASGCYLAALAASLAANHDLRVLSAAKLGAYAMYIAVPLLAPAILTDEARLKLALRAWLVGAALAVAIGLAGVAAFYLHRPTGEAMMCGWGGLHAGNVPRICAPFSNQNMFCNYLSVSAALALGVSGTALPGRWAWALAIAAGVTALFTMSAGVGGFALACTIALLAARRLRGERLRLPSQALAAGALLVAAFFAVSMLGTLQPKGQGNVPLPGSRDLLIPDGMRPSIWAGVMPAVQAKPILGIGYGKPVSVTTDPRAFAPPDEIPRLPRPIQPHKLEGHNVWLSVLGQAGVLGLLTFLWLVYELARKLRVGLARPLVGALPAALLGVAIGAFLYHGMFASLEESRHLWAVFGLVTAVAAVNVVNAVKEKE
jgi:hypothetical protein